MTNVSPRQLPREWKQKILANSRCIEVSAHDKDWERYSRELDRAHELIAQAYREYGDAVYDFLDR